MRIAPLVGELDPAAELRGQWDALIKHALVALERQVAQAQRPLGTQLGADLLDVRLDVGVAERSRDRDTVVAVLDEVQLPDPVDVDRRHRLAAPARDRDPLPASAHTGGRGAEVAVKFLFSARDRADDRVEPDLLDAEVVLTAAAERRDHFLERQHHRHVVGLEAQPRGDLRKRAAPALAGEV